MNTTVRKPQSYNSITVSFQLILSCAFIVIIGKLPLLCISQFSARLYCTLLMHEL